MLENIPKYFGCGEVKQSASRANILTFKVVKFSNNFEKIMPFFLQYNIQGIKLEDFNSWCQVAELIKAKKHLTHEGLEEIRQIKSQMNRGRAVIPEVSV